MQKMVLSILIDNTPGALSRVVGLFSRRGYNIDSLTVGETENTEVSRMTVAVTGVLQLSFHVSSILFFKIIFIAEY